MNTISITTSQNIELEYDLGSVGDRILGKLIDLGILIAYGLVLLAIIAFSDLWKYFGSNYWMLLVLFLPVIFYDLVSEIILNGQSIGKRVMAIKVISLTGEQPTISQYIIRWLFRLVDFSFTSGLLALIMVAVSDKKQRLGDMVADTVVVKTKPRTDFNQTIYTPPPATSYTVIYPEVMNLRDTDIQLVREVITSVYKSRNMMLAWQAQEKVETVLRIKSKHQEPMDFLRCILSDYNYLTSQM